MAGKQHCTSWLAVFYLFKGFGFGPLTADTQKRTCMTALDSMGTGLLMSVLRVLSSRCQETEARGSPDAWHSRLMGSPTLTLNGPAGVTTALGDSETQCNGRIIYKPITYY